MDMVEDAGPLVEAAWLMSRLGDPEVRPVDTRFSLADPGRGRVAYAKGHIPGAVYLDLERDLSSPVGPHGGRHPLPDVGALARALSARGVDERVHVVAYDDAGGEMACRLWWLLGYLGHRGGASVLSGGLPAWTAAGGPLTAEPAAPEPRRFVPRPDPARIADLGAVRAAAADGRLLDARAPERFRGEVEPIDKKAGHIPGARNRFWKDGLASDGRFGDRAHQAARFADLPRSAPPVVYCGSGVTACADLVALAVAGRADALLYPGSFSDWVSYPDRDVAVGAES